MRRILAIFAHPDDEGAASGTLARYARQGAHVSLICTTKGEAGEISDPALATPATLGATREAELRCACEVIGIHELHFLGYCDSGMEGTPENRLPTAFIQANPDEVHCKLVRLLRAIRPDVVITFEPNGWYGHPDHVATSRYASQAYYLAGDPIAFPEAGPPWRPLRLYHAAFLRDNIQVVVDYAREHGIETAQFGELPFDKPDALAAQVTHALDVRALFDLREKAMRCHRTQFAEDNIFVKVPAEIRRKAWSHEYFIQVDPSPEPAEPWHSDLLSDLPE